LSFAGILDVAREALALITTRVRERLAPPSGGLHHVGLPYAAHREREARAFYGGLLGLVEKPVPGALADRPFIWFAAGDGGSELHLIPEAGFTRSSGERHACLRTDRLDELTERLSHAGHQVDRYEQIVNRRQAFVHDPFGNLLELTELTGDYA
jgi:catechol 2,3-dioxygenase-like lactoylglutathione lyase family enzyme